MIGLSIYLSYGYARQRTGGAKFWAVPGTTPGWLLLLGLGSMLIAIGILAIPHHASVGELSCANAKWDSPKGGRTIVAVACIWSGK